MLYLPIIPICLVYKYILTTTSLTCERLLPLHSICVKYYTVLYDPNKEEFFATYPIIYLNKLSIFAERNNTLFK